MIRKVVLAGAVLLSIGAGCIPPAPACPWLELRAVCTDQYGNSWWEATLTEAGDYGLQFDSGTTQFVDPKTIRHHSGGFGKGQWIANFAPVRLVWRHLDIEGWLPASNWIPNRPANRCTLV